MISINFTTDDRFYNRIKKIAGEQKTQLSDIDKEAALLALNTAYQDIVGVLTARGLSAVEISSWARGEEFQLDIATYWYGRVSGWSTTNEGDRDWLTVFDRRQELNNIAIIDNSGEVLVGSKSGFAVGMNLLDAERDIGHWI
jgi:hypothetical protein